MTSNTQQAVFEHQFWLQIMGDHGRFIFNALAPNEANDIQLAQQFIEHYDRMLEDARKTNVNLAEINQQALQVTMEFRKFKLELLRRMLLGTITFGLPPTFINHM